MRSLAEMELELSRLGMHNRFWGRPEVKELTNVLSDDEVVVHAVNGRYDNGFCLLVATDRRLVLIDKKIMFLSMEDIRFDMISELDYCARLLDATLSVTTINKIRRVTALKKIRLRALTTYLQERILELRHVNPAVPSGFVAAPVTPQYAQQTFAQPLPENTQMVVPVTPLPIQQVYANQVQVQHQRLPDHLKRIGSYPTASLTMQKRFSR